jgi:hypothetical protein
MSFSLKDNIVGSGENAVEMCNFGVFVTIKFLLCEIEISKSSRALNRFGSLINKERG